MTPPRAPPLLTQDKNLKNVILALRWCIEWKKKALQELRNSLREENTVARERQVARPLAEPSHTVSSKLSIVPGAPRDGKIGNFGVML